MRGAEALPVRVSCWWVGVYTKNAPSEDAADRRAELASDIHEQLDADREENRSRAARSVLLRTLRGIPGDIAWRAGVEHRPGRLTWHVDHPASVLTLSLLVLLPLDLLADMMRQGVDEWRAAGLVGLAIVAANTLVVAFGTVSLVRFPTHHVPGEGWSIQRFRRVLLCGMSVAFAVSGIWRFAGEPLYSISALAWGVFGVLLIGYLVVVIVGVVAGAARRVPGRWLRPRSGV